MAVLVVLVICGTGIAFAAQDASEPEGTSAVAAQLSEAPNEVPGPELPSKRTATSDTFRLPDGSLETRIFENPINYRDAEGDWKPIEEGLEEAGGASLSNGANRFDISLPSRLGADHPVRLSMGDEWIAYQLVGPASEPAELEGDNGASYESANGGTSFDFSSLANGLKENIEIADPSQPSSFDFELSASAGLTPELAEDGAVKFRNAEGDVVATLPAPVMSDSSPGSQISHDIWYRLEPQGQGQWRLTLEADRNWLLDPERQWPARIDPTLTVLSPSLDCWFEVHTNEGSQQSFHGCGSSGLQTLTARYKPQIGIPDQMDRSALRFNLESIPAKSYIADATMGLYAPGAASNTSGVEALRATKDWTNQASWFKYDGSSSWMKAGGDYLEEGSSVLTSERGAQAGWWNFSAGMTGLVRKWFSKEISNQGLIVKLKDDQVRECGPTSCTERRVEFKSSADSNPSLRPYLSVNYYPPAPSSAKVKLPKEGTTSGGHFTLKAGWTAAEVTGLTFQMKLPGSQYFETIPANLVRDANGQQVTWPVATQGKESPPLYFDAASHPALKEAGPDFHIQIRALFEGPLGAGGYTTPVNVNFDRFIGASRDATTTVGPGSVDLLTGNFTVGRTDVSIPAFGSSLEFSRTLSSRAASELGSTGVLGAGWRPSVPVEAAGGAEWLKVTEVTASPEEAEEGFGDYAVLTDLEGYKYAFPKVGESYESPPEAPEWILSRQDATHLALTDPQANRTIFEKNASGTEYLPVSVSQTGGSGNTTRMVYQFVNGKKRLSMAIAPTAPGIECPESGTPNTTTILGCRTLTFSYKPASTWGAPSNYGDRLASITYYGPASATSMSSWEVANYKYNSSGQLIEEWDPRISPALKETYGYEGALLHTLTPPGEEPWTMSYSSVASQTGRLVSVSRPSLLSNPSNAKTTIAYGVPISGVDAPYDLSGSAIAQWGQQDQPTDATAVFPPDQVPSEPPSSYSRATLYYMDPEGQLVNTATPSGAGTSAPSITTTETDEHGNVTRELSAQNRLRALAAGASSVARSHELETKHKYSADGSEMLEEWGPLHAVRLESGPVVQAQMYRTLEYDVGAPTPPAGTPTPHLPTREVTRAWIPSQSTSAEERIVNTQYNWTLRKPTDTIVDPSGLNLRTHIEYDAASGLPTERRLPANPNGGDAHTTKIIYYTAGANAGDSACGNKAAWANLPCKTLPAKQPGTDGQPELLVTQLASYNALGEVTETIESPGGDEGSNQRRVVAALYDAAGRQTFKQVTGGGGASIPIMRTLYSSTNGMPTSQRFFCLTECTGFDNQATTTTYDKLGRPEKYEDADGNVSSTTYDLLGRPVTTSDGKGIQTRTYDPTSGLLVKLEDSGAGTFTAAYDADGNLVEEGLPDGLLAKTTYDETGQPTHLSYEKKSCSIECTWLDFGAERSIYGQVLSQTSLASSQQYSYDKAGRLTIVRDTPQGGGCTTRSYSFDEDSNRTALVTRAPGIGGACDLASEGSKQTYSYDAADRLTGTGIVYDNYGRITTLPGVDAGGETLTTSYYSNNLVKSQTQGAITNSYELDGALRQRTRTETGGSEPGTEVYHYAGGSDSPAWIDSGSSWSRNVVGIGGGLAAIQDSAKGTTLQLTNLHGDIIATASTNPEATKLLASFEFDEFGNPKSGSAGKYGWLGGKGRRTEFPTGIIQMGVRSYVPTMGRFISTDPVQGGSANAYDYTNADPVNGLDLAGTSPYSEACLSGFIGCKCKMWAKFTRGARGRMTLTTVRKCNVAGGITLGGLESKWGKGNGNGFHSIPPPKPVAAQVEPLCRPTDPCQNYQKHVRTFYCEPGKEYEFSLTWEFQINLEGLPAHTLDVKIEQFCPR